MGYGEKNGGGIREAPKGASFFIKGSQMTLKFTPFKRRRKHMDDFHAEWARARLAEEIQSREELDESLYLKQVHKEYLRQAKERVEKEKIMERVRKTLGWVVKRK